MRPLALFALWIGLVALACGCANRVPCLDNLGLVDAERGLFLIFDKCDGTMYLDMMPRPPHEGATPDQNIPDNDTANPKVES